jgi:hypothetical protein
MHYQFCQHMDLPPMVLLLSAAIFMKNVCLEEFEMCIFSVLDGVSGQSRMCSTDIISFSPILCPCWLQGDHNWFLLVLKHSHSSPIAWQLLDA